jgi:hypothetical protein
MGRLARGLVMAGLAVLLAGCGTLPRNPVPPELTPVASIPGMLEMRAWAGRPSAVMERDFERSFQQESPADFPRGADGTVDLDSQQFVVWNTGLIAASGGPEALDLFREVMLASASIPIAFPPVFFEVEADGRRYDEMHVDGAVAATVFLNAGVFRPSLIHERAGRGAAREDIFVIHNGKLSAASSPTPRSLRGIASRVIEASVRAGVVNDLIRIFAFAQRDQASFHWVTIDESVDLQGAELFDPVRMGELYEIGYRTALTGPEWEVRPPGFQEVQPPP